MRRLITLGMLFATACAFAEVQVINGVKYECKDGLCTIVDDDESAKGGVVDSFVKSAVRKDADGTVSCADGTVSCADGTVSCADGTVSCAGGTVSCADGTVSFVAGRLKSRVREGYCSADEFVKWLKGHDEPEDAWMTSPGLSVWSWVAGLLVILLGGLAMNLTPCVLPMVPINLMVIGKSAARGAWYGLGIALAYGTLGVAAAIGGLVFGTIQGSPWFNLGVAVVFVVLALALADVFFIDLSKGRNAFAQKRATMLPWLFAFLMGVLSAVLAGACVAPILIGVLVLTAKLYGEGHAAALALPFVLGVGMALPWPFLGAGMKVLPSPGRWMKTVNRLFALVVLGFAVWYGRLAWLGFGQDTGQETREGTITATPSTFNLQLSTLNSPSAKPILVDCWATWCKNCAAMDRVMEEPEVREALKEFTVIRLQAEDMKALRALKGFESIKGLPAFVLFVN